MIQTSFIICLILFPLLPIWLLIMAGVVLIKQNMWLDMQIKKKK